MIVLVTGAAGQLGHDVINELDRRGHFVIGSDVQKPSDLPLREKDEGHKSYMELDITDAAAVRAVIEEIKPDAVIHCAAWTAVDDAEDEANRTTVDLINRQGTRNIAEAAKAVDAKMLYLSTVGGKVNLPPWGFLIDHGKENIILEVDGNITPESGIE